MELSQLSEHIPACSCSGLASRVLSAGLLWNSDPSSLGFKWDLKLFPRTSLYFFYSEAMFWSATQWQWRQSQGLFWHSQWCHQSQGQCKWAGTGGSACLKFSSRECFKSRAPEEHKSKSSDLLAYPMNFFNQHQARHREWLFTGLKGLSLGKGQFLHGLHWNV